MHFPRLVLLSCDRCPDEIVARPLLGGRQGDRVRPWVAVATGREEGRFVLARREDRSLAEIEALIAEAGRTVAAMPYGWTVSEESGILFWKRPSLLRGIGDTTMSVAGYETEGSGFDDASTELLLRPDALADAAEQLRSRSLVVVIPKRGWLLVAPGAPGEIARALPLLQAAAGILSGAGRDGISRMAIFVSDGQPAGVQDHGPDGGYVSLMAPDEGAWFV